MQPRYLLPLSIHLEHTTYPNIRVIALLCTSRLSHEIQQREHRALSSALQQSSVQKGHL